METTFRSCTTGIAGAVSAAAQKPQNRNPPGFSFPQAGQGTIARLYALALEASRLRASSSRLLRPDAARQLADELSAAGSPAGDDGVDVFARGMRWQGAVDAVGKGRGLRPFPAGGVGGSTAST
jgi:hypothetical protein